MNDALWEFTCAQQPALSHQMIKITSRIEQGSLGGISRAEQSLYSNMAFGRQMSEERINGA